MVGRGNLYDLLGQGAEVPTDAPIVPADLNDGYAYASPPQAFEANPYGLHDMFGNVSEWCRDLYAKYDKNREVRAGDGERIVYGTTWRVRRGGSFADSAFEARPACRNGGAPGLLSFDLGVRPARALAWVD